MMLHRDTPVLVLGFTKTGHEPGGPVRAGHSIGLAIPFSMVKFDCGCGTGEVFIFHKLPENSFSSGCPSGCCRAMGEGFASGTPCNHRMPGRPADVSPMPASGNVS